MPTQKLGGDTESYLLRFQHPKILGSALSDAVNGLFLHHNRPESEQRPAKSTEEALERLKRLVSEYKSYPHLQEPALLSVYQDYCVLEQELAEPTQELLEMLKVAQNTPVRQIAVSDNLCTAPQWNLITRLGYTGARPTRQNAGRLISQLKKKNAKTLR